MVKKTRRTYLLRTIKKNGVSFFAVALIAATSIAIYLGIQSGAQAILEHAARNFEENRLATFELSCANGITQEDVAALAQEPDADIVEGGYQTTAFADTPEEKITIQIRSLLKEMNLPTVLEGKLPQGENEVAVEQKYATEQGVKVGDTLQLEHDGQLRQDSFVITAIINEPSFSTALQKDTRGRGEAGFGAAAYYVEVAPEAFDPDYYDDCYTTVYLESKALTQLDFYSDAYTAEETRIQDALEGFGQERAQLRYDSLSRQAADEISQAEQELEDAEREYRDGAAQLEDGKRTLEDRKQESDTALVTLQTSLTALGLPDDLDEAKKLLDGMGPGGAELSSAITAYQSGLEEIAKAEEEIAGKEVLLKNAEKDIASAQERLEEGKQEADKLLRKDWVVSGRNDMGDVRAVKIIVDGLFTLSYSFALIFLLVAIVVCYAAVVKMIDDQRSIIGAQKALGFRTKEVFGHFLSYNVLCAFLGILIGCIASVVIVENLVLHIFAREFVFDSVALSFVWGNAAVVSVLCLVIFVLATVAGCTKVVRQSAISLLRGELPTQQKAYFFEAWKPYQKLSLYSRTMIKNVLSDKGRILTTIMGVVGCVSLLIITFTLKFAVTNAPQMQFDHYFFFENRLAVNSEVCDPQDYEAILKEQGVSFIRVQDKLKNFRAIGGSWDTTHVVALEDDPQLRDYILLEDAHTQQPLSVPNDGVLISKKCADNFDLEVGSQLELMDADGNPRQCTVSGVIEHYLPYHQLLTSVEYYEQLMGEQADTCIFLLRGNIDGLYDRVKDEPGFLSLKDNAEYLVPFEAINLVIIICFIFSAVLSVLVLLNQMNMYINRKARELAVMRINGYTLKETKTFVSKDNIVLIALGLIVGCAVGTPLAQFEVMIMETGTRRYITTPSLLACFLSVVICVIFALIINAIALRRINHLSLTNVSGN